MLLIITLNYQQLPGKEHYNMVFLSVFYKKLLIVGIDIDILGLWSPLVTLNFPKLPPNYLIANATVMFAYPFYQKLSLKIGVTIKNL